MRSRERLNVYLIGLLFGLVIGGSLGFLVRALQVPETRVIKIRPAYRNDKPQGKPRGAWRDGPVSKRAWIVAHGPAVGRSASRRP